MRGILTYRLTEEGWEDAAQSRIRLPHTATRGPVDKKKISELKYSQVVAVGCMCMVHQNWKRSCLACSEYQTEGEGTPERLNKASSDDSIYSRA